MFFAHLTGVNEALSSSFITLDQFKAFPDMVKFTLSFLGALVIFLGALVAVYQLGAQAFNARYHNQAFDFDRIRLNLGKMIILGLEFIVASDVVETTTTPDYYSLGILGVLVIIRTVLNFTLDRDLKSLSAVNSPNNE